MRLLRRLKFILQIHRSIPFMYDVFVSNQVSLVKKVAATLLFIAYALFPFDVIPDFLLFLGIVDEIVLLGYIMQYFVKIAPPELRQKHNVKMK
jgi:uncharacterized membrane protein YkvA (DUF1232 family)